MPYIPIDTCFRCGKEIEVKNYKSYRVREDYRLICENCAREEKTAGGREEPGQTAATTRKTD